MKLKHFRQLANLTQAHLAKQLGCSELSIIKYEAGTTIPSKETLLKIFTWSDGAVTPNDFFDLEEIKMTNAITTLSADVQGEAKVALGLMSGTSMDGIDACLLMTDGERFLKPLGSTSLRYQRSFHDALKAAENAVRETKGDISKARLILPELDQIVAQSTAQHAQIIEQLLEETGYKRSAIDIIGYHGQTLFHAPANKITIQVGDGAWLADKVKIPVVYDFRVNDVVHGGQGAPFAPLYHQALATQSGLTPVVVANCGGLSNITLITGVDSDLFAFDTGPGNGLIDRFVKERTGKLMDENGAFGLRGKVDQKVLAQLKKSAVKFSDGTNYLERTPPKSLDINDLVLIPELNALSLQDGCATLEAFTAECIVDGMRPLQTKGITIPTLWILAGGGWKNPVIVRELRERLITLLGESVKIELAERVGWDGTALESQIFAYLAVRSLRGLPLSVPGTTGVPQPLTGGKLVKPKR